MPRAMPNSIADSQPVKVRRQLPQHLFQVTGQLSVSTQLLNGVLAQADGGKISQRLQQVGSQQLGPALGLGAIHEPACQW